MPASTTPPPASRADAGDSRRRRPDGAGGTDDRTVLGRRYRLERRLAQGGMAEVWLATDLSLDRRVAVKWLKPSLATDPIVAERFRREAVAVASLAHPNIVAVHDVFEENDRQVVVMQLVDGKSLRQLLDVQTRLSADLTMHIGMCVSAALDAAHRSGFVHRDVKPGNILITQDGRVLLTDFGIAKGIDGTDDLTSDNVMMGTAKYLSPEQVRGRKLDGRADLYSLGLVMYECLAGRVPFVGSSDADTALARLQRDPTDLARLRPTLSAGLVELIHRLLARNPNRRPRDGAELRGELQRVAAQPTTVLDDTDADGAPHPSPPAGTPRRPAQTNGRGPMRSGPGRRPPPPIAGEPTRRGRPVLYDDDSGDHTPTAAPGLRGKPARDMQTRLGPSTGVIALLIFAALVLALVVWASIRDDNGNDLGALAASTTVAATTPPATGAALAAEPADATAAAAAPDELSLRSFDPEGDGVENDEQLPLALADGDPATHWSTVCYANRYAGKSGVGLVATLPANPNGGRLTFAVGTGPSTIDVFARTDATVPDDIAGWGDSVDQFHSATPAAGEIAVPSGTTHLLLLFREIGDDPGCTRFTYRGQLGELTFTPS